MFPTDARRRPAVVDLVAVASLALSALNVVWLLVIAGIAFFVGGLSWLGGPIVGVVGTFVAGLVLILVLVQSLLSLLLFAAGLRTWQGLPAGRSLHVAWGWSTVVLDLIDLAVTAGMDGGAWIRLVYAVLVLLAMNRDDVRAYLGRAAAGYELEPASPALAGKPAPLDDEF